MYVLWFCYLYSTFYDTVVQIVAIHRLMPHSALLRVRVLSGAKVRILFEIQDIEEWVK